MNPSASPSTAALDKTVPMAPGIRRLGRFLRWMPGTSIAAMDLAQIERVQSLRKRNPVLSLLFGDVRPGVRFADRTLAAEGRDITVRVYTPEAAATGPRPLVLAIHGGGFVLGNLLGEDWMASTVCRDLDAIVVSVDYRLAPRHPFPAAVEDCYAALCWATAHASELGATAGKLGVMGESAGGNLSAVLCLLARERGGPAIHHQTLLYPGLNPTADTESRRRHAQALILTAADSAAFHRHYLGTTGNPLDWRVSPALAPDHRQLPPALIIVAGHDLLHDDGVAYAGQLQAAGVPTTLREFPAMPHGFLNFPRFSRDAEPAMALVVQAQRAVLLAR